ncbi:MAG: ABC transporter permease [Bacteroidota bacterium]
MFRKELWQLIIIHLKELIREPGVIFWGIGFPLLMAWGLGIAFSRETRTETEIPLINYNSESKLADFLEEQTSENYISDSLFSFNLEIDDKVFGKNIYRFIPLSKQNAITGMKKGKYSLLLESDSDSIYFYLDPANPDARSLQLQLSSLFDNKRPGNKLTGSNTIAMEMQGTRYIDFLIPGLIGMSVMMACMWGISYTIIERRKGNMLRRMVATPMKKSNLLIAHMTARLTMNFLEAFVLVLFAQYYFNLKVQGSWAALFLIFIAGNFAFTGIAFLFSSRTSNTEIGNALVNLVTMPMLILSGIFFSYQNFPDWAIPYIEKLPLTMMADSFRSIINEGARLNDVMENFLILGIGGIITFVAGLKVFKWY